MVDNLLGSCAETTSRNNRTGKRTDYHINLSRIDILVLRDTTTVASKNTERPGLVQDEAEFVFRFEFNLKDKTMSDTRPVSQGEGGPNLQF